MVVLLSEIFCPWHYETVYLEQDTDKVAVLNFATFHRWCSGKDVDDYGPLGVFVDHGEIVAIKKIP